MPGTAILSQLAVHPDCRGLGVGERLIDAAEAWASEQGFATIHTTHPPYTHHAHQHRY
ncbi:MAG: N-acetyltransferase [Rubrivivax sp.]|nr:MAG: N-acetyltransferase [Rubrivivax sp.]